MYSINGQSGRIAYGVKSFICDNDDDILTLPTNCEVGSKAFVIESSRCFILNNKKEWKEYQCNSGGGSNPPTGDIIYDGGFV